MEDVVPYVLNLSNRWILGVSFMPWLLYSWEKNSVPTGKKGGWASEPVWMQW
jgi:hypothetical protein